MKNRRLLKKNLIGMKSIECFLKNDFGLAENREYFILSNNIY